MIAEVGARARYGSRARLGLLVAGVGFAGLTIALEAALHLPMRLPGHRALPGALALLLFAEVAPAWALALFASAVPLTLAALGHLTGATLVPWLTLGVCLLLLRDARFRHAGWFLLTCGLVFGALRYGALLALPHKTPGLVRLAGHLAFGGLGGLIAALSAAHLPSRS